MTHRFNIIFFSILLLTAVFLSASKAQAADPFYKSAGAVAASGYDVVAYFAVGKPVKGDKTWQTTYRLNNGQAVFYFSSDKNLKLFLSNPKKYAPQFGGYCAYAAGNNYIAKSEPEAFTIYKGLLYLNYSLSVRESWLADKDNLIMQGKKNWPTLLQQ